MKLTSNWSAGRLFWRTFNLGDTVYITGLRQGFLSNGQSVDYKNPTDFFQMEVKRGDGFGPFLEPGGYPGRPYRNDDELIVTDAGIVDDVVSVAVVVVDPGFKFEFSGAVVQFFSAASTDTTIKITSSFSRTTSNSTDHQATVNSSASNETGAQVGAQVTGEVKPGDVKVGVNVSGSISSKVINKIEHTIADRLNVQVSTATSYTEEQTINLKAGKLTVITSSWQRRFVTGNVTVGHEFRLYDATLGYMGSRQIVEYSSAADLPPELAAVYAAQNPGYQPAVTAIIGIGMNHQLYTRRSLTEAWVWVPGSGDVLGVTTMPNGTIIGIGMDHKLYTRPTLAQPWVLVPGSGDVLGVTTLTNGTIIGIGMDHKLYTRPSLNQPWVLVPGSGDVLGVTALPNGTIIGIGMDHKLYTRPGLTQPWVLVPGSGDVLGVTALRNGSIIGIGMDHQLYSRPTLTQPWVLVPASGDVLGITAV